jgi:precorrin-6x reductase
MAAGLRAQRVACLRPTESGLIETALIQRWQIDVILARQSGGAPEGRWQRIAAQEGCRLLLLRRPSAGHAVPAFTQEALLRQLAQGPGP